MPSNLCSSSYQVNQLFPRSAKLHFKVGVECIPLRHQQNKVNDADNYNERFVWKLLHVKRFG